MRFWDHTQAEWYKEVLKLKNKTTEMKWIKWDWMDCQNDPVFNQIKSECARRDMVDLMGLEHGWNTELVVQFYATLWLEFTLDA